MQIVIKICTKLKLRVRIFLGMQFYYNKDMKKFIISGFFGTIILAIGLGLGMEFKDKMYGNKFDYTDLNMTIAGGVIGQILQVLLLILLF